MCNYVYIYLACYRHPLDWHVYCNILVSVDTEIIVDCMGNGFENIL